MAAGFTLLVATLLAAAPHPPDSSARGMAICSERAAAMGILPEESAPPVVPGPGAVANTDEDTDADEEDAGAQPDVAAPDDARDYSPVLVASVDPSHNCSEPPTTPPAVLDCNDERATIWVHEMIGSCAMPPTSPHPSVAPVKRSRGGTGHEAGACHGLDCVRDPLPLTSGTDEQSPSWVMASFSSAFGIDWSSSPLPVTAAAHPSSAPSRRNERPPKHAA